SLSLIDPTAAMHALASDIMLDRHVVAIAEPASGPPLTHAAFQAAADLLREVLEEEGVHGAFQSDMELVDLTFAKGHKADTGEAQLLEEGCDILLVAREAVQRFGNDYVESASARFHQHALIARPQPARAALSGVREAGSEHPPFCGDFGFA